MKRVSVIIPCHNAVQWLPKCFLSLVNQSMGMNDIELIFVDDASEDAGPGRCYRISSGHIRRVLWQSSSLRICVRAEQEM